MTDQSPAAIVDRHLAPPPQLEPDAIGYDGSDWPRHDGLKWPHLGVVIGSGMGVSA